jgi:hypothetical protein
MNRTNSLIILAMIIIGTFIISIQSNIALYASALEEEEQFNSYPLDREEYYYTPLMEAYDPLELPEYLPSESYGNGYYDQYESGYYEEQGYGIPYNIE